jgi:hypothetical protein
LTIPWTRGLAIGFLAGYAGMLIHAIGANTFIIVRIMEPFWLLAGLIVVLVRSQPEAARSNGGREPLSPPDAPHRMYDGQRV